MIDLRDDVRRVTVEVLNSRDDDFAIIDSVEDPVREPSENHVADLSVKPAEDMGIGSQLGDSFTCRQAKLPSQTASLLFVSPVGFPEILLVPAKQGNAVAQPNSRSSS